MLSKKELELEIANKGAEVLKERIDKVEELEERIRQLERKALELEIYINTHKEIIGIHKDNFKEILDALESNLGIIKETDERFRRHVNNTDVHISVQ